MIESITNLPVNVVAFTASGQVTADDYENVIIPLVDDKWIRTMIKGIGRTMPGEIRTFANGELDQAKKWVSE